MYLTSACLAYNQRLPMPCILGTPVYGLHRGLKEPHVMPFTGQLWLRTGFQWLLQPLLPSLLLQVQDDQCPAHPTFMLLAAAFWFCLSMNCGSRLLQLPLLVVCRAEEKTDITEKLRIRAVPLFHFYKGGELLEQFPTREKSRIAEAIKRFAGVDVLEHVQPGSNGMHNHHSQPQAI